MIWRYLARFADAELREDPLCLCRKIVRWSVQSLSLGQMLTCLDIFAEVALLELHRHTKHLVIRLLPCEQKRDLNESITMQRLTAAKEN